MKKTAIFFTGLIIFSRLLSGCGSTPQAKEEIADIYIDESFKPLFDTSIPTFESQIQSGRVIPHYVSELGAIEAFKNNQTKTICITREFTPEETKYLAGKNVEFTTDHIGTDALALIVNPACKDSAFTLDELKAIFTGKDSLWKSTGRKINIVFDQSNSSNFYYIYNLVEKQKLSPNISAVKSNEEVIELVRKNSNVLGIIGANWINDTRDSTLLKFKDGIKVCDIAYNKYSEYFQPYPAYIYNDVYPMTRKFYLINKGSRVSLYSQFVRFMTGQRGQMIIYKSNLIPSTMVAREIEIVQEK